MGYFPHSPDIEYCKSIQTRFYIFFMVWGSQPSSCSNFDCSTPELGNAHFSVHTFLTRTTSYNRMHKVVYSLSMAFDSLVLGTAMFVPPHIQLNHWAMFLK